MIITIYPSLQPGPSCYRYGHRSITGVDSGEEDPGVTPGVVYNKHNDNVCISVYEVSYNVAEDASCIKKFWAKALN